MTKTPAAYFWYFFVITYDPILYCVQQWHEMLLVARDNGFKIETSNLCCIFGTFTVKHLPIEKQKQIGSDYNVDLN